MLFLVLKLTIDFYYRLALIVSIRKVYYMPMVKDIS